MAEIIRPTLLVDKNICIRNIKRMADKAVKHKLKFRPHFKTHQSAKIGEWFKTCGVNAITVSSVQMAEYFATNGWDDITLAFPVNILEITNINHLAAHIKLNVLVENEEAVKALLKDTTNPLGVYLKIDTGYMRTGISSLNTGLMNTLLDLISKNKYLTFKGFLSHAGHTYQSKTTNEICSRHFDALIKLNSLKDRYIKSYPKVEISIGDTPSTTFCDNFDGVDEIRPGNFVFYDLMQHMLGVCKLKDVGVKLVCPVVSKHPLRNEIIIYGGAVHFSKESIININGEKSFGRIIIGGKEGKRLLDPLNYVAKLSQEHGTLKVAQNQFNNFQIGDLVEIIPVHSCLTAHEMGYFQTTEGEIIEMMPKY